MYAVVVTSGRMEYLRNLVIQLNEFCTNVILVVDEYDHKFDELDADIVVKKYNFDLSEMRNFGLLNVPLNEWYVRFDDDELPTTSLRQNMKEILKEADRIGADRIWTRIYHLTALDKAKLTVGIELRIMKRVEDLVYRGKTHELPHAHWKGEGMILGTKDAFVHLKFLDKERMEETENRYLPNGMYEKEDWESRKAVEDCYLPSFIDYSITDELMNKFKRGVYV